MAIQGDCERGTVITAYEIMEPTLGDKWIRMTAKGVVSCVPMDPANSDYQQYLAWVAEDNEPEIIKGDPV